MRRSRPRALVSEREVAEAVSRLAEEWVQAHYVTMLQEAETWRGRAVTAEDIVQEALLVAVGIAHRCPDSSARTRAWLRRIVRNVGRATRKRRVRRAELLARWMVELDVAAGYRLPLWFGDVSKVIEELTPRLRVALVLRLDGWSDQEIAEHLGTTRAAVRKARSRAVQELRKRFAGGVRGDSS